MSDYNPLYDEGVDSNFQKTATAPNVSNETMEQRRAQIQNPPKSQVLHYDKHTGSDMVCRNCLCGIEEGDDFIAPCHCSGSMKWVHRHCLDQWRVMSPNPSSFYVCDNCHAEYKFDSTKKRNRIFDYAKYVCLVVVDFSVVLFVWQFLVLVCCLIVLLADMHFVVSNEIFGKSFPKPISVWLLGNGLFLFCLGVLGTIAGLALGILKLFGFLGKKGRRGEERESSGQITMTDITYRHSNYYFHDYFLDYLLIWYLCQGPVFSPYPYYGGYGAAGPCFCGGCPAGGIGDPLCLSNMDCMGLGSNSLDFGDCSGGDSNAGGGILAVLAVILIVVIVIFITIGIVIGTLILVYAIYSIMSRRMYVLSQKDKVKSYYVVDLEKERMKN